MENYVAGTELSVKISDVSLSYDDLGSGDVPLIFIHGFPFDKTMWHPQLRFLSEITRVIAYDIRGFGNSEKGLQKFSIDLFARDLVEFMDALQIKRAVICGLSMGGYIALNAYNRNPERFAAIILSDTQCIADSAQAKEGRQKTIELIKNNGIKEFTEGFLKKIFFPATLETQKEMVEKIRSTILETSADSIMQTLAALAERDETCSILGKISVPALIICGDADVVTPPEQSQALQNGIPGSAIRMILNAGHVSNVEQPAVFNNYIAEFLADKVTKG